MLMTRSVIKGETDFSYDRVIVNGVETASQSHKETAGVGRVLGPRGSELYVSDNRATDHYTNDPRDVYDWVKIPPGKEKVLFGDKGAMRVLGVSILNLKMH